MRRFRPGPKMLAGRSTDNRHVLLPADWWRYKPVPEPEKSVVPASHRSSAVATCEGRIQLDGLPSPVRAFANLEPRSMFTHITPASRTATNRAG
jgi:hypothetical protein